MNIVFTDTEKSTQRKIKRYSGKLAAAGSGVILFGVWSIVKVVLFNSINQVSNIDEIFVGVIKDKETFAIALYVLALFEFAFRFYVGESARREAFGKKRNSFYLVVATILFIISVGSTAYVLLYTFDINKIGNFLITALLEGTSSYMFGALIYYSIKTKQMTKLLKTE